MDNLNKLYTIKSNSTHFIGEDQIVQKIDSKKQLRIKLGADPTSPDLHLGHAVVLRKIRQFQELGHKAVIIIGDFTAMIGDPSGKSKTRPKLSLEDTKRNGQTYIDQISKVLSLDPYLFEFHYNSTWLNPLNFKDLIELAQTYTVARMLERDDFSARFKNQIPISIHEFLYPLAQGYDSVAIKADVEIGGTDQLFKLIVGREVQKSYKQEPQIVMTLPLLEGISGGDKMSKSLNNYIGLNETPEAIYTKAMQISDTLLLSYFKLCSDLPLIQAEELISSDIINAHKVLGEELVRKYHSESGVQFAIDRYESIVKKEIPQNIETFEIPHSSLENGEITIVKASIISGMTKSISEAKRLILNKGIKINGAPILDPLQKINLNEEIVLSVGKNNYKKIVLQK